MKKYFCPYCDFPLFLDEEIVEDLKLMIICESCEDSFLIDKDDAEDSSIEEMEEFQRYYNIPENLQ